jgi:Na+/H+-dicarboxylate symporter
MKKFYHHLYVQVLIASGIGILLGATYTQLGQKMQRSARSLL